jgi:hypothetical protein
VQGGNVTVQGGPVETTPLVCYNMLRFQSNRRGDGAMRFRVTWIVSYLIVGVFLLLTAAAHADPSIRINKDADRVAIGGYDSVAYFTEGRPVEGIPELVYEWQDALWRFSRPEHLAIFAENPERYAPRYGGFCTGGMALGVRWVVDPEAWAIVDDRLYLNFLKSDRDDFVADPEPYLQKADANWETLGRRE